MCMAVGTFLGLHRTRAATHVVVLIVAAGRRKPFEEGIHVLEQQRLILLDDDGRGGVLREHGNPSLRDPGSQNNRLDPGGDVDELARGLGLDLKGFRPEGQATGTANSCLRNSVWAVEDAENRVDRADSSSAPSGRAHVRQFDVRTRTAVSQCCAGNLTTSIPTFPPPLGEGQGGCLPPGGAHLVEAVAAIDGPAHAGRKWYLGGLAALGADHFMKVSWPARSSNIAVDRTAIGTARGLVLESLGGIKLLLTQGENEVQTTVTARQGLVAQGHGESPFLCLWISESSPERAAQPSTQLSRARL